ncbi:LysM peptidoglycan-binding domain-containing protein [Mycobacterium sp. 050128]|uniref:LysM peptidoglycan-binding domain-containing protein n=1 Tax=Mycobacterium sp. 050128 TaxID=3096112 RepID=UPI002ED81DFB
MPRVHTVLAGETLSGIARDFYGDASMYPLIAQANQLADPNQIFVGQVLQIPEPPAPPTPDPAGPTTYTVVAGDTLWDIAVRFYGDGTMFPLIAQANAIENPNAINPGEILTIPPRPGPGATPLPGPTTSPGAPPQTILPYASEPFGVYQPLIGWRSQLHQERVAEGMAVRLTRAANLIRDVTETTQAQPVPQLGAPQVVDRTDSQVGRQLAAMVRSNGLGDGWASILAEGNDSALTKITRDVLGGLNAPPPPAPGAQPAGPVVRLAAEGAFAPASAALISREAATASLLQYLGKTSPDAVKQLFTPAFAQWQRVVAAVQFLAEQHPSKLSFLSPIGLLHRFREYFFELGTFLGPPVGHVWISPGGMVELYEANTRRTLVERTVEQSTEETTKSETEAKDQDELSDAVKTENDNDMKLGVSTSASGGVGPIFQASGSSTFNLDVSRKQAQEDTHKHMREQSSKLSSEVRQNYKTTFRTVTETTDTSSRRYVLQNNTDRLVSYELSRKMRKVAVQVQDLGQQLCWQLYVDRPGDPLGLGEFVHEAAAALDPGLKQPEVKPRPDNQEKTYQLSIPFILYQGGDDDAEDTYSLSGDNADHGIFSPDVGKDDIIQFKFDFKLPPPPAGTVLDSIGSIDFKGAQVKYQLDDPGLMPNPNVGANTFSMRLTHANFGGQKQIPFEATIVYAPTPEAIKAVDDENAAAKKDYDDQVAAAKEALFYATLRKRLKLSGQVKTRNPDDLREEERTIIYRKVISRLYGNENGWTDDDYHVASELIRYFFDVDAMLYFVAPDWWRPRPQPLVPMTATGELQPTTIVDTPPATGGPGTKNGRPYYLVTEETTPAPLGTSLGWLIQLDGDANRNAFLNSPWVKAVLPIRPGREREAITWLQRPEVAATDGLSEPYPFDPQQDPPEYQGKTIEDVLLIIADKIAAENELSLQPIPIGGNGVNQQVALPTEVVFAKGFDPLAGGIDFGAKPFKVFSQWTEILPTDQVVATEYSLKGL